MGMLLTVIFCVGFFFLWCCARAGAAADKALEKIRKASDSAGEDNGYDAE